MSLRLRLPKPDEWGTPVSKMPNCPVCDEDELGMMEPGVAFCYRCGANVYDIEQRPELATFTWDHPFA
jgi:hypothetical protein